MNEKSKIYIVFGVLAIILVAIIGYNIDLSNKSKKEYAEFTANYTSEEEKIVFIGREDCSWCQLFRPIFDYYSSKYDISYSYIDKNKLINRDFNKLLKDINVDPNDFGTPLVVFVKNGEVTDTINGYVDENALLKIFQDHNLVDKDKKVELNYLDFESLKKVVSGKSKSVIVVGQTHCPYCIKFKTVLMNAVDTKGAKIYYLNYDAIEADQTEVSEYFGQFEEFQGKWGTPLTIVVEKGKIVDSLEGYRESEEFIKFLQKHNLVKE